MALPFDPVKMYAREMAIRLQVMENMVRSRVEFGGRLTADEMREGVRLSHEEFLYLARAAMQALNQASKPSQR